ncbi:MAG: M28 family peptidase [Candidatus Methylomirabilis sp.]|nr:M28 family peptidase [Deltaproteobacteria bacterium]
MPPTCSRRPWRPWKRAPSARTLTGITLLPGDEHYRQSDHFPFAERGIPALSIGDGNFVDYHLVTDDAGAVDGRRVQAAMRVAAELGRRVAMDGQEPQARQAQAGW